MSTDATLRMRELSQLVYDIGDEVAEYIEHVAQAAQDWDAALIADCLVELNVIVQQARTETRPAMAELNGLRQALTSGVRSGTISAAEWIHQKKHEFDFPGGNHPGQQLSFLSKQDVDVAELPHRDTPDVDTTKTVTELLDATADPHNLTSMAELRGLFRERNEIIFAKFTDLIQRIIDSTDQAVNHNSILLPQVFVKAEREAISLAQLWNDYIYSLSPEIADDMRGEATPEFLSEKEWLQGFVQKYQADDRSGVAG